MKEAVLEENRKVCSEISLSCRENLQELRDSLLEVAGLSELFNALANETRTRILYLLSRQELCTGDLAYILDMSLPAISHHLRLLRTMRLVRYRKEGKHAFYCLDDEHVLSLVLVAQEHFIAGK